MTTAPLTLEDLDLFKVLHLTNLTEDERAAYGADLLEEAFQAVATEDIPQLISPEDLAKFNDLFQNETTQEQALPFLKSKIPNLDDLTRNKILAIKKTLILANMEQRLDFNKLDREKLREEATDHVTMSTLKNQQERTILEQLVTATKDENWTLVDTLSENL